jgi:hypothetical protein
LVATIRIEASPGDPAATFQRHMPDRPWPAVTWRTDDRDVQDRPLLQTICTLTMPPAGTSCGCQDPGARHAGGCAPVRTSADVSDLNLKRGCLPSLHGAELAVGHDAKVERGMLPDRLMVESWGARFVPAMRRRNGQQTRRMQPRSSCRPEARTVSSWIHLGHLGPHSCSSHSSARKDVTQERESASRIQIPCGDRVGSVPVRSLRSTATCGRLSIRRRREARCR